MSTEVFASPMHAAMWRLSGYKMTDLLSTDLIKAVELHRRTLGSRDWPQGEPAILRSGRHLAARKYVERVPMGVSRRGHWRPTADGLALYDAAKAETATATVRMAALSVEGDGAAVADVVAACGPLVGMVLTDGDEVEEPEPSFIDGSNV